MKKIILTLLMGAATALQLAGAVSYGESYEAEAAGMSVQPETVVEAQPYMNYYAPVEFSTEKPTEYEYISTELSTEATYADELETEARTYNGIAEGDFIVGELTYYDVCPVCTGKTDGITKSGYIIENGVQSYTASCNWLPFGASIEVDGVEYTIRDRGGQGLDIIGHVDIFEPSGHEAALENGRRTGVEITIAYLP